MKKVNVKPSRTDIYCSADDKPTIISHLREAFRERDLLFNFVIRDISVVYKQTVLGMLWAVINPIMMVGIFTIIFGKVAKIPTSGIPYHIFSLAGVIAWNYFNQSVSTASTSTVSSAEIFKKIYFPRIFVPLTPIMAKLLDFSIAIILMLFIYGFSGYLSLSRIWLFPLSVLILVFSAASVGMFLSALSIKYRDVKFVVPLLLQIMMYAAPVVFPAVLVKKSLGPVLYFLYTCYPLVGAIEGMRSTFIPMYVIDYHTILMGLLISFLLLISALNYYSKVEKWFADVA